MISYNQVGINVSERRRKLRSLIRSGNIILGGNRKLKIYGMLNCKSGKKMKPENRVFFSSAKEAIAAGYRPCGHCMAQEYKTWKENKKLL